MNNTEYRPKGKLMYPNLPEDDVYNPKIYPDKKNSLKTKKMLKLMVLAMMMNNQNK